jgi:biotin/methionine sulfoxide reductase
MVRRGWLERGPGPDDRRGEDEYVPVSWDRALDFAAQEFERVRKKHGCDAIFGGSYGWSSAGRFHHAQSQVHRFLNCIGGYTASVNTYSAGAAEVILPHIMGSFERARFGATWSEIGTSTDLIVAFGGMAAKNSNVGPGGIGRHEVKSSLETARERGTQFINVSPLRDDFPKELSADWLAIIPSTDVALMLGVAHTLVVDGLHDTRFLARCCEGFDQFESYLLGAMDSEPKSAEWASRICGISAPQIRTLAGRMSGKTTLITVSHSLQRAQYGEQPVWMGMVLAAMLGMIGVKGGGYAYSLGALAQVGKPKPMVSPPPLPQGRNAVNRFIPVARIADMLLNPGGKFSYNGHSLEYPNIKLLHWAGGNPFHHHQHLSRLRQAFARPDTIIVHEPFWTSTACHADILLPSTITLERNDIGGVSSDNFVIAMQRAIEPYADSRNDYDILTAIASRMGVGAEYTEGRTADEWIRHMYGELQARLRAMGFEAPDFERFWAAGELELPTLGDDALIKFRENPQSAPLQTPSGKLEIYSSRIASFGYLDCPGHPSWIAPDEWLGAPRAGQYPLQLIANQPRGRLHSQLDFGAFSQETKIDGREVMRINPADALMRCIKDDDLVKVYNDRGAFLAAAHVTRDLRPGVIQVSTGAWYDPVASPDEPGAICVNGNPNAVTQDIGTSQLAQGCTGQLCLVQVKRFEGVPPSGRGYKPPRLYLGDLKERPRDPR